MIPKDEMKILEIYYNEFICDGFLTFDVLFDSDKKDIYNTFGFKKFLLGFRIWELKIQIKAVIAKWLKRWFR